MGGSAAPNKLLYRLNVAFALPMSMPVGHLLRCDPKERGMLHRT